MIHRTFWSIIAVALACSTATAADIRRVVTGLDANNKAIALFDSRLTLNPGRSGIPAANLWITDSSPPGFSFKDDNAAKPIGLSPPDNGTAIRVVEFPPLDPAAEAKMDPNFMMKVVGDHAPARGLPVKHPLMHRTRTVDYAVILSGEIDDARRLGGAREGGRRRDAAGDQSRLDQSRHAALSNLVRADGFEAALIACKRCMRDWAVDERRGVNASLVLRYFFSPPIAL